MNWIIPETIPRAALITGGDTDIGIRLAYTLADAGFGIALQCMAPPAAPPPAGSEILSVDLSVERRAATLVERATARIGPIGVLINAAVSDAADTWDEPTQAAQNAHLDVALRAPLVLTRQFAQMLPDDHEGVAINLIDQGRDPNHLSRTLANAALWSLTQAMALSLAPRIRVNGVARGTQGPAQTGAMGQAVLAILALPSMTGHMMVPNGVAAARAREEPG